jgi:hypothetical protein
VTRLAVEQETRHVPGNLHALRPCFSERILALRVSGLRTGGIVFATLLAMQADVHPGE